MLECRGSFELARWFMMARGGLVVVSGGWVLCHVHRRLGRFAGSRLRLQVLYGGFARRRGSRIPMRIYVMNDFSHGLFVMDAA